MPQAKHLRFESGFLHSGLGFLVHHSTRHSAEQNLFFIETGVKVSPHISHSFVFFDTIVRSQIVSERDSEAVQFLHHCLGEFFVANLPRFNVHLAQDVAEVYQLVNGDFCHEIQNLAVFQLRNQAEQYGVP